MKELRAGMAVFLMLAAAACASHAPDEAGPAPISRADSAEASTGLQVQVDNQNINDMNIYLLRSGSRFLVGQAGGLSKTTLTIPEAMTPGDLRVRLIAVPRPAGLLVDRLRSVDLDRVGWVIMAPRSGASGSGRDAHYRIGGNTCECSSTGSRPWCARPRSR